MRTIGIDLQTSMDRGLLHCYAARPTQRGLETHLAQIHEEIRKLQPDVAIVDPISALLTGGTINQVQVMLLRLIDQLKSAGTTSLFLSLQADSNVMHTDLNISSLMDTWLVVKTMFSNDDEQRLIQIVKSRGMAHPLHPAGMLAECG
jgi:circadian clock protein KaiC